MEKRGLDDGAGPSDHNKRQKIPALGRFGSNFEDCFYSFFFVWLEVQDFVLFENGGEFGYSFRDFYMCFLLL